MSSSFIHFAWWAVWSMEKKQGLIAYEQVIYELCVIIGVIIVVGVNSIEAHRVALVGFLAAALAFTTSVVNTLVYSSEGAEQATAAGHIFLSMVNIVWIYYFGTTSEAAGKRWMESYSVHASKSNPHDAQNPYAPGSSMTMSGAAGARPGTSQSAYGAQNRYGGAYPKPSDAVRASSDMEDDTDATRPGTTATATGTGPASSIGPADSRPVSTMTTEYPLRAKAIYSYDANEDDPNEVSFSKGEILEVSDTSGKWWPVRKSDGSIGIVPSNYVALL